MIRGAAIAVIALTIAVGASLTPEVMSHNAAPGAAGFECFRAPILGGTDEPDANGMYPPAVWGRACGTPQAPDAR